MLLFLVQFFLFMCISLLEFHYCSFSIHLVYNQYIFGFWYHFYAILLHILFRNDLEIFFILYECFDSLQRNESSQRLLVPSRYTGERLVLAIQDCNDSFHSIESLQKASVPSHFRRNDSTQNKSKRHDSFQWIESLQSPGVLTRFTRAESCHL